MPTVNTGGIIMEHGVFINDMAQAGYLKVDYSRFKDIEKIENNSSTIDELNLEGDEISSLKAVGVNLYDNSLVGKFLIYGTNVYTSRPRIAGVEIIPLKEALLLYPDIKAKYYFKAVDREQDEVTRTAYKKEQNGYFIRVKKNVVVDIPIHTALFMHKENSVMCIHNIVVLEEGAQLHLITGCTSGCTLKEGLHIAVSEHFVGKGAKLTNTMIHNWGSDFVVRPKTATIVEDDGTFVSNYYSVKPPKNIQTNPFTHLKGKNASAKYMTVLASLPNTYSDIGGTVLMTGENSGAELVARAVNHGGTVNQTGLLIGAAKGVRAHVDCSGLMLSTEGVIEAIPGLRAMHPDARMSHEAAIGKIDTGEVNYLQSKGLEEMQAIALIVRGFLDIGIEEEGFEPELQKAIQQISELSGHGEE
ncbi:SufD family Fe-S cluster assembly protein [Marinilabiliaceae bacterium JC017]|nr:SufD family Fe-S cluster assembly protein [Marinilabiliaceae bacterium JC017]